MKEKLINQKMETNMKKTAIFLLSSVALSAHAQYSTSIYSSVNEFSETTLVPYSIKFEGGGGALTRTECYTGKGCFAKYKNPQGNVAGGFGSGKVAIANPPPNPNVTMWMAFTLKGKNIFGSSQILNHIPIFVRANMTNMSTAPVIEGIGLAIFNANGRAWNPNINCIQPNIYPQDLCYSGIRVETAHPGQTQYGALPAMLVTKQDGIAFNGSFHYSAPAQYLLNDVEYTFTIHAQPAVVAGDITASSINSSFSFQAGRPAEYGNLQWNNMGYIFALLCSDATPYPGSCENYKYQNFSLEIKNIGMGWF